MSDEQTKKTLSIGECRLVGNGHIALRLDIRRSDDESVVYHRVVIAPSDNAEEVLQMVVDNIKKLNAETVLQENLPPWAELLKLRKEKKEKS